MAMDRNIMIDALVLQGLDQVELSQLHGFDLCDLMVMAGLWDCHQCSWWTERWGCYDSNWAGSNRPANDPPCRGHMCRPRPLSIVPLTL